MDSANRKNGLLADVKSRQAVRLIAIFLYFILFQSLILLQKPFLQFSFAVVFYSTFGLIFAHNILLFFLNEKKDVIHAGSFLSYLLDFIALVFFMKHFSYLSSFILVLQLFLLFIASFDLSFTKLSFLGFVLSLGASVINLSTYQSGSIQSILSLVLFNLSYLSIIIISRQLRSEFFSLESDLSFTQKKWKSQERFSATLLANMPLGLAVVDRDRQLVLNNQYLNEKLSLSGSMIDELIGNYSSTERAFADINFNERIFNIDKTNYFDEEIGEDLNIYLIKDVTEMRHLENKIKENEKLAAVGTLAAGIAHEIRNPLAGISGSIQLLSQDTSDPTQKKLMDIVLREINRLNDMITEFLDYAKPEKQPSDPVNLKIIIEEILSSLKQHPELPANFVWSVDMQDALILGFSEKLKQALLNIFINSIQASAKSVTPKLEIKVARQDSHVVLTVKDCGSGMSEETRKKMFEPFHTTKPKGTGLGLAITHKILDVHKADILVKSELNVGTEFIIKMPLAKNGVNQ